MDSMDEFREEFEVEFWWERGESSREMVWAFG
jgi:hypothetical protein